MEIEHSVKTFNLDSTLEKNLADMTAEGWLLIPGVVPVGVYHVVRMKGAPAGVQAPVAKVHVDDSKVFMLRDGKLIDKDGNVVDPATVQ